MKTNLFIGKHILLIEDKMVEKTSARRQNGQDFFRGERKLFQIKNLITSIAKGCNRNTKCNIVLGEKNKWIDFLKKKVKHQNCEKSFYLIWNSKQQCGKAVILEKNIMETFKDGTLAAGPIFSKKLNCDVKTKIRNSGRKIFA